MFRIKICGITNVADAGAVGDAGADAIGLNFYARSQRYVEPTQAQAIAAVLPAQVCKVGLFVNETAARIHELHHLIGLDLIQLHGDESPEFVAELAGLPVLKAFRARGDIRRIVAEFVARCGQLQVPLAGVLIDAYQPGSYGGTGQVADWQTASELRRELGELPLVLAGGLTPSNVAAAIAVVQPWGVDTASGVEVSPGQKDSQLVAQFIAAAKSARGGAG